MENITIKLKSPVSANGEVTSEITLREPTGKDITQCGMPFRFSGGLFDRAGTIDTQVISNYISMLGNVTQDVVEALKPADWIVVSGAIVVFFSDIETPT